MEGPIARQARALHEGDSVSERAQGGLGIFGKMLLVMLMVALVPTGAVFWATYQSEVTQLRAGVEQRLGATGDKLAQYTDQWLEGHLRMLRMVASHPDIASMDGARQKRLLVGIHDQYPYIYLAHTIRLDNGMNEGRSDGNAPLYYGDRAYIRDCLGTRGYGLEAVVGKTSGLPAFIIAVPIFRDGAPVGVLSAALLIDDISRSILDASIGKTGFAFFLDAKGRVVAHPDKEYARVQKDLHDHPALVAARAAGQSFVHFTDVDGKPAIAAVVTTREEMTLVAQQSEDEANAPLRAAERQAAEVFGGSVLLVVFLAFVFSRGLTSPIRRLTAAAEAMSMGEMSTDVPEASRGDELGGLARAIERMGVSLKLAMSHFEAASPSAPPPPRRSMTVPKAPGSTGQRGVA